MQLILKLLIALLILVIFAEVILLVLLSKSSFNSLKNLAIFGIDSENALLTVTNNSRYLYDLLQFMRNLNVTSMPVTEDTSVELTGSPGPLQIKDEITDLENSDFYRNQKERDSDFYVWLENTNNFLKLLKIGFKRPESAQKHSGINPLEYLERPGDMQRPLNPLEEYYNAVIGGNRNRSTIGPKEFGYVINPGNTTCGKDEVFLFAFILTAVHHYEYRRTIRMAWGRTEDYNLPVRRLFFVGRPTTRNSLRIQESLESESNLFGDIVQENYADSYSNLTYKSLSGFRWTVKYCSQAAYVLKIDDDTFVNMFALLDLLKRHSSSSTSSALTNSLNASSSSMAIFGRVVYHDEVHRSGKWAVHVTEFRFPFFPRYCSGPAYVTTMSLAMAIVNDSMYVPFFRLEDLYVTGFVTLLREPQVRYVQLELSYLMGHGFPFVFVGPHYNIFLFAIQIDNNRMFKDTWNYLKRRYINVTLTSEQVVTANQTKAVRATLT